MIPINQPGFNGKIRVFFARLKSLLFGVSPEQESLRDFGRRENSTKTLINMCCLGKVPLESLA